MLAFFGGVGLFFVLIGWHDLPASVLPTPPQQPAQTSSPLGMHPLPAPFAPQPRHSPPQKKAALAAATSPHRHLQAGDAAQPPLEWQSARLCCNHLSLANNAVTAARDGREGAVWLRAAVDRAAKEDVGSLFSASGLHCLVDSARGAVQRWRLKPTRF